MLRSLRATLYIHPSKKVTQHDFDRLYFFFPGFVFLTLDIPGSPVYLPFDWCLICSDCFTEACVGWVNWGAMSKRKSCKIDRILWEMRAMSCFVLFLFTRARPHCSRCCAKFSTCEIYDYWAICACVKYFDVKYFARDRVRVRVRVIN